MNKEYFNSTENTDFEELIMFNEQILNLNHLGKTPEKHWTDASGYTTTNRYLNMELKERNQELRVNEKGEYYIHGWKDNGSEYDCYGEYIEQHKVCDMLLDYVVYGYEPIYINFLDDNALGTFLLVLVRPLCLHILLPLPFTLHVHLVTFADVRHQVIDWLADTAFPCPRRSHQHIGVCRLVQGVVDVSSVNCTSYWCKGYIIATVVEYCFQTVGLMQVVCKQHQSVAFFDVASEIIAYKVEILLEKWLWRYVELYLCAVAVVVGTHLPMFYMACEILNLNSRH